MSTKMGNAFWKVVSWRYTSVGFFPLQMGDCMWIKANGSVNTCTRGRGPVHHVPPICFEISLRIWRSRILGAIELSHMRYSKYLNSWSTREFPNELLPFQYYHMSGDMYLKKQKNRVETEGKHLKVLWRKLGTVGVHRYRKPQTRS